LALASQRHHGFLLRNPDDAKIGSWIRRAVITRIGSGPAQPFLRVARDPDGVGKHWAGCRFGNKRRRQRSARSVPLHVANPRYILNHMVQYTGTAFDASFAALSDATRRGVLEQLGRADASITDLAGKFHMTLTGMKKHVGVLEQAGLVTTEKVGRVRTCKLGLRGLEEEAAWIERYRQHWAARFDELDKLVEELKQKEKADVR
jgi:DNA-binding transcriptional ArsR family regulator